MHVPISRSSERRQAVSLSDLLTLDSPIPLHRSTLVDMLKSRITSQCKIHTGKALTSYTIRDDGRYTLQFADGTTAETDVLVGADGVHSVVRRLLFEDLARRGQLPATLSTPEDLTRVIEPQWSGSMVYRSLIQTHKLRAISPNHSVLDANAVFSVCHSFTHDFVISS